MLIKRGDAEFGNVIDGNDVSDDDAHKVLEEAKADVKSAQEKINTVIKAAADCSIDNQ